MKNNLRLLGVIVLLLSIQNVIHAQSQLGFHTDNYAGINAVQFNPAATATTPFSWDLNLSSAHLFLENNYAFFNPTTTNHLLNYVANEETIQLVPEIKDGQEFPVNTIFVDYYRGSRKRFALGQSNLMGPSLYVRLSPYTTIGVTTAVKGQVSFQGLSDDLSYYTFVDKPTLEEFTVDKFKIGAMSWGEVGLNLAHTIETSDGELTIGATLKYLSAYNAGYFINNKKFEAQKLPGDSLLGSSISFEYAYTNTAIENVGILNESIGTGFGADLGVVYTYGGERDEYIWKLGFSLMDLGVININNNAVYHKVETDFDAIVSKVAYENIQSVDDLAQAFSQEVLQDSTLSLSGSSFKMGLPTAASVQFDYQVAQDIFVNATLVQGISLSKSTLPKGTMMGITPRIEKRWVGLALPVSTYNFNELRVGLAARLAFFTFGTDNLGSFVGKGDWNGTDFYVAVKVNPFSLGNKDKGGYYKNGLPRSRSNAKEQKCYEF